ncbi:MAG: hypothetical protein AB7T37_09420 [Dehalococcoidia bacterium]
MRVANYLFAAVTAMLLLSCADGGQDGAGNGTATAASTPATSVASPSTTAAATPTTSPAVISGHPPGTRTGNAAVDAVIEALEAGDGAAIDALVNWELVPCRAGAADADQPECPIGVADDTLLEAIREIGCDWKWHVRPSDHRQVKLAVDTDDRLWSVWSGPPFEELRDADVELVYVDNDRPGRFKAVFLRAGRIVVDYRGCEGGFDELGIRGWGQVFADPSP